MTGDITTRPATANQSGSSPAGANGHARPLEIEEALNRWFFHPISGALVELLVPTGISPNAVSAIGVVMMALACGCYAAIERPWGPVLGVLFHIGWHVFDGADGQLARRTGRSSPMGEIVDGVCDHLSHLILYVTLGVILARTMGGWAWPVTIVSGGSRALQSMSYETARRSYRRWVYGVNWIRQDVGKAAKAGAAGRAGAALAGVYLVLSRWVSADDHAIDEAMDRLVANHGKADAARALYQSQERKLVKRASWLSTDFETIGVFLSLMAGSALYFLAFQATVLNLVMAWCVISQVRSYAALIPKLRALEGG